MKKIIILLLLACPISGYSQSNEVIEYVKKLEELLVSFEENALSEDQCRDIWHDVQDFKEEIDNFRSSGKFDRDDSVALLNLSNIADLFDDYFVCIGGWTSFPMSITQFYNASQYYDGANIVYISKDVFCTDIVEYRLGELTAYFMINDSNNDYKVTYTFGHKGSSVSGEFGLPSGTIRILFDNRDQVIPNYKIMNITCTKY